MKIGKFCVLLAVSLLTVLSSRADEKSKALLSAVSAEMAGYKSFEVEFTSSMKGEFSDIEGKAVVSGSRYYMNAGGMEIFYDGESVWTYTHDIKQVVREKPRTGANLLDNPVRFFKLNDADFLHRYQGRTNWHGRAVEVVELKPRAEGAGYKSMILRLDATTGRPLSLSYEVEGSSIPLEITVRKITPNVPVSDTRFTFDRKVHKDVEVVDFR